MVLEKIKAYILSKKVQRHARPFINNHHLPPRRTFKSEKQETQWLAKFLLVSDNYFSLFHQTLEQCLSCRSRFALRKACEKRMTSTYHFSLTERFSRYQLLSYVVLHTYPLLFLKNLQKRVAQTKITSPL